MNAIITRALINGAAPGVVERRGRFVSVVGQWYRLVGRYRHPLMVGYYTARTMPDGWTPPRDAKEKEGAVK